MTTRPIRESITIAAPIARCFALSTRIELVQRTLAMTPVAGPDTLTEGHITHGSRVHWHGWKFGLPTHHHTLITRFEPPHPYIAHEGLLQAFFQDTQEQGRFARFQHDHFFREKLHPHGPPRTTLHDEVRFRLPFGPVGRLVAQTIMAPHIRRLTRQRFALLKHLAETEAWREWV